VAILSRVSQADPVAAYRTAIVLIIAFFVAAAAVSAVLLTRAVRPVPAEIGGPAETGDAAEVSDGRLVGEPLLAETGEQSGPGHS